MRHKKFTIFHDGKDFPSSYLLLRTVSAPHPDELISSTTLVGTCSRRSRKLYSNVYLDLDYGDFYDPSSIFDEEPND